MKPEEVKEAVEAARNLLNGFALAHKALGALDHLETLADTVRERSDEATKLRNQIQGLVTRRETLTNEVAIEERKAKEAIAKIKADVERAKAEGEEELRKYREGVTAARVAVKAEMDEERAAHDEKLAEIKRSIRELKKAQAVGV